MRKIIERIEITLSLAAFLVSGTVIFGFLIPAVTFGETTFLQIVFGFMMSIYLWLCLMTVFYPFWSLIKKYVTRERRKKDVPENSSQS